VKRTYHSNSQKNITTVQRNDIQVMTRFLTRNGQVRLPMVELIEQSRLAVDELIDVLGRASVEALQLSAEGIAGPPHPGMKGVHCGLAAMPAQCSCDVASTSNKLSPSILTVTRRLVQR
jgi:hypothetical protein